MDDLITLKDASLLTGKSEQSIRRWKRDGKIEFISQNGDKRAYVSRSSILTLVGQMSQPVQGTVHLNSQDQAIDIMKAYLADVRYERDELRAEAKMLRELIQDKEQRIQALEQELNKGFRGFLRGRLQRK